ncbi:DNA primase DnaG [Candidatus Methanoperedenaceae archaeon GB37]|nr:DNA primase DnaG [Candidatus Methanoperedenaceae archaeon GB37]
MEGVIDMQNTETTKYIIHAKIKVDGVIERPDVVGAIFGQTEGLLGDDLDLRELQKSGRIGRIDVNTKSSGGKSIGTIDLPSSLDKVETSILAASLETIDRIGPCVSTISVTRVEDVRSSKRRYIIDRAKVILTGLFDENVPQSQEITEEVKQSVRVEEMIQYGKDGIPAGPNIYDSDAIIVVEGRADVLTLLKYGIKNAIAVGGTNIPQAVIDLCKKKIVTAFTDGDRGGELIIKELMQVTDIDFVARAPDGKMVEELTQKEVMKALHQKIPIEQAMEYYSMDDRKAGSNNFKQRRHEVKRAQIKSRRSDRRDSDEGAKEEPTKTPEDALQVDKETVATPSKLKPSKEIEPPVSACQRDGERHMDEIAGTFTARLIDPEDRVLKEVPVRDLASELKEIEKSVKTVVFDGVITQRLVDIAFERGVEHLMGIKKGNIAKVPVSVNIHTIDQC